MTLHPYETTALQEGWQCDWCAAALPLGTVHYVNSGQPGRAFCRVQCAEDHAGQEARKRTSNPDQVGLAFG